MKIINKEVFKAIFNKALRKYHKENVETKAEKSDIPDISGLATKTELVEELAKKQDKLKSSTNIKTINGESILGSGDIDTTPTLDEVLKKGNTSAETIEVGEVAVKHEDSGNQTDLYAAGVSFTYKYEGVEKQRTSHIDYESVGFSHLEKNTSPSGGYNIVPDFVISAKNGQVEMSDAIKGAFREKLGITKEVFIAKQGTTSAAELIAAYEANQVILIVPSGTVLTSWRWVSIGLDRKSATKCEVLAIFNNGSNLDNGLTLVKFTVDGTTWTYASQGVQNKLVSGTNIKTINNQSVLGKGNLDIQLPTITGSNWGVAKADIGRVPASSSGGAFVDVDVSDLNLSSSDDYEVTVLGMDDSVYRLSKKTATSFTIVRVNPSASGLMNTVFHYIIAAKGYGSTPKGGTTGQVLTKKSDADGDVEWKDSAGGGADFSIDEASNTGLLGKGNDYFGVDMSQDDSVGLSLTKPDEYAKNKAIPTKEYVDGKTGNLTELTTTDKSNLVAALNEVYEKSGEPFRVKQWATNSLNVTIPTCTSDIGNTSIAKMTFTIDNVEGADYQIVGMIAYEVFDAVSGGNRINCWPVCQFTGNGQKELSVRWMCGGTTDKVAKRINAWVLLKHR